MTEETHRADLVAEGLHASSWSNGPGDHYPAHAHDYDKVLVCVRGSITFGLPDRAEAVQLAEGGRLDLPAGTRHDALVGAHGVSCLEAHLPAGSLTAVQRHAAGPWHPADRTTRE